MDHDAIVIGAGPAGLFSAIEIGKRGYDVQIFEEHETVGKPDHCAGLLSTSGLERLGVHVPQHVTQNTVSGAIIYSPSGYSIRIERGQREAKVIDRREFDAWLADKAMESGASITTDRRISELLVKNKYVQSARIKSQSDKDLTARVYIIAEGSRCLLSGSIGLPVVKKSCKYPAYQYEVAGVDIDEEFVEMFYGKKVAPGFFAWIIPLGDGRARVGLAAQNKSKTRLDALLRHHKIISKRLNNAKIERSLGGIVLVGLPINRLASRNAIAVGDTAGLVKATTGGGIILGGITARLAGKITADALAGDDEQPSLERYDARCKALVLKELRTMYLAQQALASLSDKGLDSIIRDVSEFGILDIIKREGDMDLQAATIREILKDPRMLLLGLKAIRYINPFL